MSDALVFKPLKILNKNISKVEIAKYYLEVEFSKLFRNVSPEKIAEAVNSLTESKVWSLLEAMSFTYHLNGVFYKLAREGYIWNEEVWKVEDLLLTGMDSNVNKVIFSKEINGDAAKFKKYLLKYFNNHKETDPEKLFSYKPTKHEIKYTKLLATEKDNKIAMLDGSHRLTEMLLNGAEKVTIFVGHPAPGISEESKKTLVGNSIFILLTILYKQGTSEEKRAVLTVVKELINTTLDGKEAAHKFWVERSRDEEIKTAGEALLKEIDQQ